MKKPIIILTIICLTGLSFWLEASTKVDFFQGSVSSAREKAASEGKLYFIDFYASWCMPCRWMDETTFSDQRVAEYVAANYIPVKVDIDDFDGYALKQQYQIKMLPTILVFNAQGDLIGRYEESLPPSKLLDILQKFDIPKNRISNSRPALMPVAAQNSGPKPSPITTDEQPRPIARPGLGRTKPTPIPVVTQSAMASEKISQLPIASGDGLFRFSVVRQASSGFSVQIGAFGEYGNVLREVARLEQLYDQPILVHIANLDQKTVYKILVGTFSTRDEAIGYQQFLKGKKVIGIIKDLSTMK